MKAWKMVRVLWLAMVCLSMAMAVTLGCKKGSVAETGEKAKPVRVEPVGRADITDLISYPATLRAHNEVRIFSTIPDRILDFPLEDGDEVKRGERIALIRRDGMDKGLANMAAQLDGVDAQISNIESELERTRGLLDAGAVATSAFDRLDTQYKTLTAQRRSLDAARGQLAVTAGNAYITSPIDGVIAGKMLERGDMAAPQIPLCRVLGVDRLKVDIRLVESDVAKVHVGQDVVLYVDAHPGRPFQAKVTRVLPYMDPATRTNGVEITLDNAPDPKTGQRALKPGMFGKAEIVAERKAVIVAPEPALLLDNDVLAKQKPGEVIRKAMVVDADGIARQRIVRCGARKGALFQVLDGLSEGDRIVVRGQHGLLDGQRVEIVEAKPE
jgi:membrane fusion protein (multidrug efflux system)